MNHQTSTPTLIKLFSVWRLQLAVHNHLLYHFITLSNADAGLYGNQQPQKHILKKGVGVITIDFFSRSKLIAQLLVTHLQPGVSIFHECLFMRLIWS